MLLLTTLFTVSHVRFKLFILRIDMLWTLMTSAHDDDNNNIKTIAGNTLLRKKETSALLVIQSLKINGLKIKFNFVENV